MFLTVSWGEYVGLALYAHAYKYTEQKNLLCMYACGWFWFFRRTNLECPCLLRRTLLTEGSLSKEEAENQEERKQYLAQYYLKNKQAILEKRRQHYLQNKDKKKQYWEQYYHKNKEKLFTKNLHYRVQNKDPLRAKRKQYYQENKEVLRQNFRQYFLDNKEVLRKKLQEYRLKNKEAIKDKQRQYFLNNKPAITEKQRQYRIANKELLGERHRQYRTKFQERLQRQCREYRLKNKEVLRKKGQAYRLRIKIALKERLLSEGKGFRELQSWKTPEKVIDFLESVAKEHQLKSPSDWYRISTLQIQKMGGMVFSSHSLPVPSSALCRLYLHYFTLIGHQGECFSKNLAILERH
jgi:hypothetical protein